MRLAAPLARAATALAVAVALVAVVPVAGPGRALAGGCAWTSIPVPSPGTASSTLMDVDAASTMDAWAVGWQSSVDDPDHHLPLAVHWGGTEWQETPMPALEGLSTELAGVVAIASDVAWAVGTTRNPVTVRDRFIVYRWNGSDWAIVRRGAEEGARSVLHAISASGADDIWAVGFINDRTLTLHWDGVHWARMPSPNPGLRFNGLFGITAIDAGRAWAVGDRRDENEGGAPLILRWNGSGWTVAEAPGLRNVAGLRDVHATSRTDVWAVGFTGVKTLALRFERAGWQKVRTPNPGSSGNDLDGVRVVESGVVWAVGHRLEDEDPSRNLILRFDGNAWVVEPATPDPGVPNRLFDVTDAAPSVVAVGQAELGGIPSTQALSGCGSAPPLASGPSFAAGR